MIYQEMFINEKGQVDFRNTTFEPWLENVNWKNNGWIHSVINRKGTAAFYDLYGHDVVKQIHSIYRQS